MRNWILAALLANMLLLAVEFHYGAFESAHAPDSKLESREKQISFPDKSKDDTGLIQAPELDQMPAQNAGLIMENDDVSLTNVQPPLGATKLPVATEPSLANQQATHQSNPSPAITEQSSALGLAPALRRAELRPEANRTENSNEKSTASTAPASLPTMQTTEQASAETKVIAATKEHAAFIMPHTKNTPDPEKAISKNLKATEQPQPALPLQTAGKSSDIRIALSKPAESPPTAESPIPDNMAATDAVKSNEGAGVTTQQEPQIPGNMQTECYTTGPIKNADELKILLDQFRSQLTELEMSIGKTRKTRKRTSYLVYYPASATLEKSLSNADILKNNYGIRDLQVFKDGEMKGAISLGVFRSEQNALSAKNRFEQKGVQAQIKPRFPFEEVYLVRMRWTNQQAAAEQLLDALTKRYPGMRRAKSCE